MLRNSVNINVNQNIDQMAVTQLVCNGSCVELAIHSYWLVNCCWKGHGSISVGNALKALNNARAIVGPQHPIYTKIVMLIDDIVNNQQETPVEQVAS